MKRVAGQVEHPLETFEKRHRRGQNRSPELAATLNGPFGPAELLTFQSIDLRWDLGRRGHIGQEKKFPASQLGPIAEVQVLRNGIALPSSGLIDTRPSPDASRAAEIHEQPGPVTSRLFHNKMTIQSNGLDTGQERITGVDVSPPGLYHP